MSWLKEKSFFSRGAGLIALLLAVGAEVQRFLLQGIEPIIQWFTPGSLLILGGLICFVPLEFSGRNGVNRWFRAAYWVGRVVCELFGGLLIGAAVILIITGLTPVKLPLVGAVLIITAQMCFIVGGLMIGGLAVAGWIAKGNEETREWARSWGRTRGAAEARSAEEDSLPE